MFESQHLKNLAESAECKTEIRNPCVAYTGIDIPPGKTGIRTAPVEAGLIVTVTSGAPHKRNDLTLAAFRRYRERNAQARLLVLGKAEAICAGLNSNDRSFVERCSAVHFAGYLGRQELYATLENAAALLTFSEYESFYMVAVEAMAVGCPVVAPDISSIRESVGEAGQLFPPGDVDAAVGRLVQIEGPEQWQTISQASREWAQGFAADDCAAIFARIALQELQTTSHSSTHD